MSSTALIDAHFQAIIERRIDAIIASYVAAPTTYVFVEGPRWSTQGHERIAHGWHGFVDAPLAVTVIDWVEGPFSQTTAAMAWVAGIIQLQVRVRDTVREVRFRASFVLAAVDGTWQIAHEHVSQPVADPYGIGDWLKQEDV